MRSRRRGRAGESARGLVRSHLSEAIRANRWRLISFLIVWFVVLVAVVAIQTSPRAEGFIAGLLLGLLPFCFLWFRVAIGNTGPQMGVEAETWTADELDGLDGSRWFVCHDVMFADFNIDHVVIGPGVAYAVETKWSSVPVSRVRRERDVDQAIRCARRLSSLLKSKNVSRGVTPVLVYWGRAMKELPEERVVERGVRIVAGKHADSWISAMRQSAIGAQPDRDAIRGLREYIREYESHQARS